MDEKIKFDVVSGKQRGINPALEESLFELVKQDVEWIGLARDKIFDRVLAPNLFLIARKGTRGIGYISFKIKGKIIETERTFVIPPERFGGIATDMTRALGKWARKNNFRRIYRPGQDKETMVKIGGQMLREVRARKGPFRKVDVDWNFCGYHVTSANVTMHLKRKPRTKPKKPVIRRGK